MPTTLERIEIWIELLEPILANKSRRLAHEEIDRLQFDLLAMRKDLDQPATVFDGHITRHLLSRRGDNRKLAKEICEKLSPDSRERLFRILQDSEQDLHTAQRKARDFSAAVCRR